jgi:two-component system cell cycle sensor histidine kinase/response regulator CckA
MVRSPARDPMRRHAGAARRPAATGAARPGSRRPGAARTGRPAASSTLRAARRTAELDAILTSLDFPLVTFDGAGTVTQANAAARALLGTDPTGLGAAAWARLVLGDRAMRHLDGRPLTEDELPVRRALQAQPVLRTVVRLRDTAGTERVLEATAMPLREGARVTGATVVWVDVTQRRKAEEALRRSEADYRALFQAMNEGFCLAEIVFDDTGRPCDLRYLEVNPAFLRLTGLRAEDVIGRTARELFPREASPWVECLASAARTGEPARFEGRLGPIDRWLGVSAYQTIPGRLAVILDDISERKRAEDGLARRAETAQARLAAIVASSHDAIFGKDLEGMIQSWNAGAERIYGWSAEEAVGRHVSILAPPERSHESAELVERIRRDGRTISLDTERIRKDGRRIAVSLTLSPIVDAAGTMVGVSTIARDIGERKQAEDQQRAASQYARSLIEASLDPLVTISPEGKITDVNRATEEVTGVPRAAIIGTDFADYFGEPERARAGYLQVLSAGEVRDYPLVIRHVSGRTIEVLYNATIYRGPDGKPQGVFAAARDITAQRRLEEQVRQSQKLEGIGRLAGGVAHDFNNLLTAIVGAADFLLEELPEGQPLRQDAADIREAAQKAAVLTRQLLTFSRRQVTQPRILDLNETVTSMDRMLHRLLGENVEFGTVAAPELGCVRIDPGQIEQVILNLVVNARDATPAGGRITIETSHAEVGEQGPASRGGLAPGRYAVLSVRDTGHGMNADVRSHLFEPFFTTKEKGKGTGLGLSTAYGIVKEAGGDIRVRSEPGRGSTFEVYLPRLDLPAEADEADREAFPRGNETVLLVEDEPMVRRLAARVLRGLGYTVREAPDGVEALRLVAGHTVEVDLVVTDVVMPRLGGRELAARLRAEQPHLAVLFISGYTENVSDLQGLIGAGVEFLQKPFTPASLARSVRSTLEHGRRRPG